MAEIIIAAAAGATGTVVGSVLSEFVHRWLERRHFTLLGRSRRAALDGRWAGTIEQVGFSQPRTLDMIFHTHVRSITGSASFVADEDGTQKRVEVKLRGGLVHERFLKLEYRRAEPHAQQFGVAIFELSPTSRQLAGSYVGFGVASLGIVLGTAILNKI